MPSSIYLSAFSGFNKKVIAIKSKYSITAGYKYL